MGEEASWQWRLEHPSCSPPAGVVWFSRGEGVGRLAVPGKADSVEGQTVAQVEQRTNEVAAGDHNVPIIIYRFSIASILFLFLAWQDGQNALYFLWFWLAQ